MSASGNIICVSTPDKTTELSRLRQSHQPAKQQATPRQKTVYLNLIHDALKSKPDEPSSLEDILNWILINQPAVYKEYGAKKLRSAIQTSLSYQAKKMESKRTVWAYKGGTWQLHKAVVAEGNAEEDLGTHTERDACTPSTSAPSMGGPLRDSTLESSEDTPPSELRQTCERDNASGQTSPSAIVPRGQAMSRLASIGRQPSNPPQEADARTENENLSFNAAALGGSSAVSHSSSCKETLTEAEPTAEATPVTPNNEPCNNEENRCPKNTCDQPKNDGQDELDCAQIMRDLRRLKQERKLLEQKINSGRNSLPATGTLTQSANEAERAAEEAQRIADEARRAAETAKKAVEDAQAKHHRLATDELHLEKLTQASYLLRAQLDID